MSATESVLNVWTQADEVVATVATEAAVRAFVANLGDSRCPSRDELQSAINASRGKLREFLFDRKTINALNRADSFNDSRLDAIALKFSRFAPPLNCPPLPVFTELNPIRMSLAAMLGAVFGGLIGSFVGIYFLAMRDVGLLVGAPLGAFALTWGLEQASRSVWISRTLITALGVATAAEVWAYLSVNPVAVIWRKLSGRDSIKRITVYLLIIALLVFTRRRVTYDREILEQSVRQSVEGWLHNALRVLAVLIEQQATQPNRGRSEEQAIAELGKRIIELNSSTPENLQGHVQDVIESARDAGFEGLDNATTSSKSNDKSVLTWAEPMRERYDSFGYVEDGDTVFVEQEPVVRSGDLLKKGLVRKQRGN